MLKLPERRTKRLKVSLRDLAHLQDTRCKTMRKSKGYRHGTRHLFRKHVRKRGLRPLDYLLRDFNEGDIVDIIIDPSEHKGMPHRRYHGKTGEIIRVQGKAYVVTIKQGRATKQIIAKKEHLRMSRSVIQVRS